MLSSITNVKSSISIITFLPKCNISNKWISIQNLLTEFFFYDYNQLILTINIIYECFNCRVGYCMSIIKKDISYKKQILYFNLNFKKCNHIINLCLGALHKLSLHFTNLNLVKYYFSVFDVFRRFTYSLRKASMHK